MKHTVKYEHEDHRELTAPDFKKFLEQTPDNAAINVRMFDRGTQRDPEPYVAGLIATWEEEI